MEKTIQEFVNQCTGINFVAIDESGAIYTRLDLPKINERVIEKISHDGNNRVVIYLT